jgi:hypothetical protein
MHARSCAISGQQAVDTAAHAERPDAAPTSGHVALKLPGVTAVPVCQSPPNRKDGVRLACPARARAWRRGGHAVPALLPVNQQGHFRRQRQGYQRRHRSLHFLAISMKAGKPHLRGVLPAGCVEALATPIFPVQRAPFASARPPKPLFTAWIEAKAYQTAAVHLLGGRPVVTVSPAERGDDDHGP